MKVEDHADTNHRESQGGNGGGLLLLAEERRVDIGVAAVEAGVLLEPLLPEQLPGPAHHLLVAHRRRVRRQHGLHRAAERAARLSADGRLVVRRHVRGRLVRLAPAQEDAAVGARRRRVVVAELGAGVGAEEREEVVGDVVGRVDARGAGEVADDGGVREEAAADGARGGSGTVGEVGDGGGADLLLASFSWSMRPPLWHESETMVKVAPCGTRSTSCRKSTSVVRLKSQGTMASSSWRASWPWRCGTSVPWPL